MKLATWPLVRRQWQDSVDGRTLAPATQSFPSLTRWAPSHRRLGIAGYSVRMGETTNPGSSPSVSRPIPTATGRPLIAHLEAKIGRLGTQRGSRATFAALQLQRCASRTGSLAAIEHQRRPNAHRALPEFLASVPRAFLPPPASSLPPILPNFRTRHAPGPPADGSLAPSKPSSPQRPQAARHSPLALLPTYCPRPSPRLTICYVLFFIILIVTLSGWSGYMVHV